MSDPVASPVINLSLQQRREITAAWHKVPRARRSEVMDAVKVGQVHPDHDSFIAAWRFTGAVAYPGNRWYQRTWWLVACAVVYPALVVLAGRQLEAFEYSGLALPGWIPMLPRLAGVMIVLAEIHLLAHLHFRHQCRKTMRIFTLLTGHTTPL